MRRGRWSQVEPFHRKDCLLFELERLAEITSCPHPYTAAMSNLPDVVDAQGTNTNGENNNNDATQANFKDELDAQPLSGYSSSSVFQQPARLKVDHDSPLYHMASPHRGKCLIINNQVFEPRTRLAERKGTERDAKALTQCFEKLNIEVEQFDDPTAFEIKTRLKNLRDEVMHEHDCLIICVLTHGDRGLLYAKDQPYPVDELYHNFTADKCPALAGKPKLFFVQACQGSNFDRGSVIQSRGMDVTDGPATHYKIPVWADFMIVYSTIPGYYSWRNPCHGSWFIQALTTVLNTHSHDMDLLSMLTLVNRKVAFEYESNCPGQGDFDGNKQVPCITSMLTRTVHFSPSIRSPNVNASRVAQ